MAGPTVQMSPTQQLFTDEVERETSRMQSIWKRTMTAEFDIADRYNHVAALIVRWDDEWDQDLNCKFEVDELNTLFEDDFRFTSTVLKLNTRSKPQIQLNHAISELVVRHDGPCRSNLLIVYYSGHGVGVGEGELELAGSSKNPRPVPYPPRLSWVLAERDLDLAEADVLIVLDCCCAANIIKKDMTDDAKSHEVLAASGRNMRAEQPGPRSFTRHFIDSLKKNLAKNDRQPFTTFDLNDEIIRRRIGISQSTPYLFNRHGNRNRKHICLAPLDHLQQSDTEQLHAKPRQGREAAQLDLRVAFKSRVRLKDDEVARLASKMFEAAKATDLGITSIDFMGFKPRKELVQLQRWLFLCRGIYFAKKWKRLIRRTKKRKADEEDRLAKDDVCDRIKRKRHASNEGISPPKDNYSPPATPQSI